MALTAQNTSAANKLHRIVILNFIFLTNQLTWTIERKAKTRN